MLKDKFNWQVVFEILQNDHSDCWLAKNGFLHQRFSTGRIGVDDFCREQSDGYTLVVRKAEKAHVNFAQIAGEFSETFDRPIEIQLFSSPPMNEGYNWHFDFEDVFVIQTVGTKEFLLRRNSHWPHVDRIKQSELFLGEKFVDEIKCTLKSGDWLYIPAGWWHKARALSNSYHISVGVLFEEKGPTDPIYELQPNELNLKETLPI